MSIPPDKTTEDRALEHLRGIKDRLGREPDVGTVAAAIAEVKEIIQSREGVTSNFVFNLGMIPVHFKHPSYTAPQVIAAIDSYISFSEGALSKEPILALAQPPVTRPFVHPERIETLKAFRPLKFDLSRLVRYCEELNTCYAAGCWLSVAMLTRAVLDHVPPIFGCKSFKEIANNHSSSKSFKELMTCSGRYLI